MNKEFNIVQVDLYLTQLRIYEHEYRIQYCSGRLISDTIENMNMQIEFNIVQVDLYLIQLRT